VAKASGTNEYNIPARKENATDGRSQVAYSKKSTEKKNSQQKSKKTIPTHQEACE